MIKKIIICYNIHIIIIQQLACQASDTGNPAIVSHPKTLSCFQPSNTNPKIVKKNTNLTIVSILFHPFISHNKT